MHISNCTLENQLFKCKDESACIELTKTCSGHNECIDGSDEGGMCLQTGNVICWQAFVLLFCTIYYDIIRVYVYAPMFSHSQHR